MSLKTIVSTTLILTATLFSAANASTPTSPPLVVGLNSAYPPFEYIDREGKLTGFDVELAEEIASQLDRPLVIQDMDFDGEILSLKQGKIDLIISGMQITPSREKEICLVPYHGDSATSLSLIFWKKIPADIHSLEDLAKLPGVIVTVGTGTVSELFLANYPQIQSRSFEGALEPLMDVKYGKATATLVESDVAQYLQKKYPEIQILEVPVPKEKIFGFGIGIRKENHPLAAQIRETIQKLKDSGALEKLEEKWFKGKAGL